MGAIRKVAWCAAIGAMLLVSCETSHKILSRVGTGNPDLPIIRGPKSGRVISIVDDWVQVPSRGDDSNAESSGTVELPDENAGGPHPQRGPDNAAVTIVEYGDYQCPYCSQEESTINQVLKKYGGSVRLVYMDYPLSFHHNALDAAIAARCAGEQGQFWQYHDALLQNQSALSNAELKSTASQLGLDGASFASCLDHRSYEPAVMADKAPGKRAGADGTPFFLVNGHPLSGAQPLSAFESTIDAELQSR